MICLPFCHRWSASRGPRSGPPSLVLLRLLLFISRLSCLPPSASSLCVVVADYRGRVASVPVGPSLSPSTVGRPSVHLRRNERCHQLHFLCSSLQFRDLQSSDQSFFVGFGFIVFATSHLGHGLKMQAHLHQIRILLKIQMIMSQ